MITAPLPAPPLFRPRQRRADAPPIPRWNLRAVKFLAIRDSQPPLTSRAGCARFRLGRKPADQHRALMRRFDRVQKQLTTLNNHILRLHDIHILLPPAALTVVIQDAARASSLCRTLCAAFAAHTIPGASILPLGLAPALLGALDASPRPLVDPDGFFGGLIGSVDHVVLY
ncbi:hypothetical protein C8F04DRAFT_1258987 [Mycena alexandri]|uniref:Uncharacterized protein n=1 Tax=Mycena alexandri TaxID=1745969 RepID=A0AAD6X7X9_9AGAR|nr:hypothetical protein C8F04DRAFT_1258987 [Mycena alexandri]